MASTPTPTCRSSPARPVVTDGGLETDLIFHHGVDLPDFAAFPLVDDDRGRDAAAAVLRRVRRHRRPSRGGPPAGDADLAGQRRLGRPARLPAGRPPAGEPRRGDAARRGCATTPTSTRCSISGYLGPRGDGYVAGEVIDPDAAEATTPPRSRRSPRPAPTSSRSSPSPAPARRSASCGPPERSGCPSPSRSPSSRTVGCPTARRWRRPSPRSTPRRPDYFMVNCAHPTHIAPALADPRRRGARGSSGSGRTRRPAATPSSTPPPSSTKATPSSSPRRRTRCARSCRTWRSSAGAAAPTPATSPPCGVSRCPSWHGRPRRRG